MTREEATKAVQKLRAEKVKWADIPKRLAEMGYKNEKGKPFSLPTVMTLGAKRAPSTKAAATIARPSTGEVALKQVALEILDSKLQDDQKIRVLRAIFK